MAATIVGPVNGLVLGQPGGIWAVYNITAAATFTGASANPSILCTLSCQVAGTITLNDADSTGTAAITNQIFTSTTITAGQVIILNWPCLNGITASVVTTGTFSLTFT